MSQPVKSGWMGSGEGGVERVEWEGVPDNFPINSLEGMF